MAKQRVRVSKQRIAETRQAPRRKPKPVGFKDAFAKRLDLAKLPPRRAEHLRDIYDAYCQAPHDLHKGALTVTVDDEDSLNLCLLELLQALIAGDYASNKDTTLHGRQSLYGKLLATALIEGMPDVDASEFCHGMRIIHPDYLDHDE